jgi:hypothetical protein
MSCFVKRLCLMSAGIYKFINIRVFFGKKSPIAIIEKSKPV